MVWGRERERERERRHRNIDTTWWQLYVERLNDFINNPILLYVSNKNVSNRNMCGGDDKQSFRLSSRQQSFNVAFDHLENHQLQSKSQMDNYNEYTGWKC